MEVGMKCIDKNTAKTYILKMEVAEMTGKGKK